MARTARNGRRLLSFLVVATVVSLFLSVRFNYQHTAAITSYGYLLTFTYSDQLSAAVRNIISLLCLATKFGGVRVVEPFVVMSGLGVNGSMNWTEQMRFRDIYDISVFEKYVSMKHFKQLVSYETFIKDAPRKVLLVQYHYACGDQTVWNKATKFCDMNGFELVDKVCLTYGQGKTLSLDSLKKQIYSKYKPSEVVVLFEKFGGISPFTCTIGKSYRLCVKHSTCERDHFKSRSITEPSPTLFTDADSYIQKYLSGSFKYISVIVRLEYVLLNAHKFKKGDAAGYARRCLTNTLSRWRDTKQDTGITTTFLAMDVGRYGSNGYRTWPETGRAVHAPVAEFLSAIYGNETSLEEWEDTFTTVGFGQTKTSGYIAMMQKIIAAKGSVLMIVGSKKSSTFLSSCVDLFYRLSKKGQLIELKSDCS